MRLTFLLEVLVFLVLVAYVASLPLESESRAIKTARKDITAKQATVTTPKPPKPVAAEEDSDEDSDEDDDYDDEEDDDDDEFDDVLDIFGDDDDDDSDETVEAVEDTQPLDVAASAALPEDNNNRKQAAQNAQNAVDNATNEVDEDDDDDSDEDDDEYDDDDDDDDDDDTDDAAAALLFDDYILDDDDDSSSAQDQDLRRPVARPTSSVKQNQKTNRVVYKPTSAVKVNKKGNSKKNRKPATPQVTGANQSNLNFLHTSALLELVQSEKKPEESVDQEEPVTLTVVRDELTTTLAPKTTTPTPAVVQTSSLPSLLLSPTLEGFSTEINKIVTELKKPEKPKKNKPATKPVKTTNQDKKVFTKVQLIEVTTTLPVEEKVKVPLVTRIGEAAIQPLIGSIPNDDALPVLLNNDLKLEEPSKMQNLLLSENIQLLKNPENTPLELDSTALPILLDSNGNMIAEEVTEVNSENEDTTEAVLAAADEESTTTAQEIETTRTVLMDLDNEIEEITNSPSFT